MHIPIQPAKKTVFDLPPEIRNTIYELVLPNKNPWPYTSSCHPPHDLLGGKWEVSPARKKPTLLFVSKQVCSEASSIFYSRNCFAWYNTSSNTRLPIFFNDPRSSFKFVRKFELTFRIAVEEHGRHLGRAGLRIELDEGELTAHITVRPLDDGADKGAIIQDLQHLYDKVKEICKAAHEGDVCELMIREASVGGYS